MSIDFIPVKMRLPLKFGAETIDSIQIAHAEIEAYGVVGKGETPLSVAWAWPSNTAFSLREKTMCAFCNFIAAKLLQPESDPMTWGKYYLDGGLQQLLEEFNRKEKTDMPYLAALICFSPFDIAIHDAWGNANGLPVYKMYNQKFMAHDLAWFFDDERFTGKYPEDYFVPNPPAALPVWHLVGGKDLLFEAEAGNLMQNDGYPVSLEKWIKRDGLACLKIKLTGTDSNWDYERIVNVGKIALQHGCTALSTDFNCLVKDPEYVNAILDKLQVCEPEIYDILLYVEQPFPYDLENNQINVFSCSERKPLFLDESAHDWRLVKLGGELGWNGVALKVCKTQTGALLSGCWAKEYGMQLMVQDLTNPMLATIPHVLLAAHIGTIMGVECNAPQFYPQASLEHEKKHPGLYERRNGIVDLSTLTGNGLSYQ